MKQTVSVSVLPQAMIEGIAEAALNGRGLTKYFDSVRTSSEVAAGNLRRMSI